MPDRSSIPLAITAVNALAAVVEQRGGQHRQGQHDMAAWVAQALEDRHHLICEAGTGVGKSFGYLVPAIVSGRRIVVATSTKTLQDQIAADLPEVVGVLAREGFDASWAVVKGRASYVCPAKLAERHPRLLDAGAAEDDLEAIIDWWLDGGDGERDHAPAAVDDRTWSDISVPGMECPGRRCSYAGECPAIAALDAARDADLVVCNHHLYGTDINADGGMLGDHDAVVFDEAHRLEDALCASVGITLTPGRLAAYGRSASDTMKRLRIPAVERGPLLARLWDAIGDAQTWMSRLPAGTVRLPIEGHDAARVLALQQAAKTIDLAMRGASIDDPVVTGMRERSGNLSGHLQGDLSVLTSSTTDHVCWVEHGPALRTSPVSIAETFAERSIAQRPTILTSATLSVGGSFDAIARRLGYSMQIDDPSAPFERSDDPLRYAAVTVESPFDYERQARLYLPDLEEPTAEGWGESVARLAEVLVDAAGGRALILCTSNAAVARIATRLEGGRHRILRQGAMARGVLLSEFRVDETSVLVATMGFWEGVDVAGDACQLVLIDRIPFPRPDDPLWGARRDAAMQDGLPAFSAVDLPRAAMLTAQGAGRLIRSTDDRGLIVLCDRRLRTKSYGRTIIDTLPEMPVITDRSEAVDYLHALR
jgi:ATP-dependent DNA helicase DinG